ncbi:tumor necrosis factor ligand superfamily member 14 isoform X2 [Xiphias gladius]|nr:tumor necrosis factor ligand superfamily member 14 isoform X2 [Xiphias gladius]XP_039974688.1 tumor necrosis factor ligand superfamily member 14 isoform X2 [Xiphias gladius]XP_039974698.1 tumor necrosis factor ligand superfamily member 14 isoform X2 [Xiphias gladius]
MAQDGYPSVYVVDSHVTRPPVPPRLKKGQRRAGMAQTLLVLLVSVALCGMTIEACFIYHLYQTQSARSASSSKQIGAGDVTFPTKWPSDIHPSKPVAHLTDGYDVVHGKQVMAWSMTADPLLYEMDYKDRSLIIQKEGFYYVYSKVYFTDNSVFHHLVDMRTEKYTGGSITLLESRKYSPRSIKTRSNSYVGGVFHLYKNDALYVKVSNTTKIERHKSYENIFGAYMI